MISLLDVNMREKKIISILFPFWFPLCRKWKITISPNNSPWSGQSGLDGATIWIHPGLGSLTGSRTRCTTHLVSFAKRLITHINIDCWTSFTAKASSGNGTGCNKAPNSGLQSAYSDLERKRIVNSYGFEFYRKRKICIFKKIYCTYGNMYDETRWNLRDI